MNPAAIAFALAELGLAINAALWPLTGNPWWTALVWLLLMVITWPLRNWVIA